MNLVDSCGWLEYFSDGSKAPFYLGALFGESTLIVPTICIYEVIRKSIRVFGEEKAEYAASHMLRGLVVDLDPALAAYAAELGIEHKLPLADSVILATARAHNATIWTQDEHFRHIDGVRFCEG